MLPGTELRPLPRSRGPPGRTRERTAGHSQREALLPRLPAAVGRRGLTCAKKSAKTRMPHQLAGLQVRGPSHCGARTPPPGLAGGGGGVRTRLMGAEGTAARNLAGTSGLQSRLGGCQHPVSLPAGGGGGLDSEAATSQVSRGGGRARRLAAHHQAMTKASVQQPCRTLVVRLASFLKTVNQQGCWP